MNKAQVTDTINLMREAITQGDLIKMHNGLEKLEETLHNVVDVSEAGKVALEQFQTSANGVNEKFNLFAADRKAFIDEQSSIKEKLEAIEKKQTEQDASIAKLVPVSTAGAATLE